MSTQPTHHVPRSESKPGQDTTGQVVAAGRSQTAAPPCPPWLDASLYPFQSWYLTLEGHRIHYIDEGSGPVLLFLHAIPLWSFQYRTIFKGLRDRFRCIALDYPGFGLSTPAPSYRGTLLVNSQLVERFIRELDLSDITLVGHDSSCAIGLGVVGRNPGWFRGLVLSNGFAWPLDEYPGIYHALQLVGSPPAGFLIVHANILIRLTMKVLRDGKLTPAERAAYTGPFAEPGRRHHQHDMFRSITRSSAYLNDVQERLRALGDLPVLLLFADNDSTYKAGFLTRYERMFPRHRSVIIAGGGHTPRNMPRSRWPPRSGTGGTPLSRAGRTLMPTNAGVRHNAGWHVGTTEGRMASPMSLMTDGHDAPPGVYQIRVQGRLDVHWSDWLGGLAMTYAGPNGCDTLLCGPVVDQAALHGLLIKIRDLGVPLLAIQRLDPDPGPGGMPAQQPGAPLKQTKRKAGDMQRTEIQRKGRTRR